MFLKRSGFPEDSDLVMCTVTNIQHNSVFVNIHEYNRQGMITISEIAPGRIRNIRDYVLEGKVIVCKILHVNKERGYIDLSLRRVAEGQRREKGDELKQEIRAEKIIEMTAHQLKIEVQKFYDLVAGKIIPTYMYVYQAFNDAAAGTITLKEFFDEKTANALEQAIRDKIKPKILYIAGDVSVSVWTPDGVNTVRDSLLDAQKANDVTITYLGGGKYRILVKGLDYKTIEKQLTSAADSITATIKKHKGKTEYERVKNLAIAEA